MTFKTCRLGAHAAMFAVATAMFSPSFAEEGEKYQIKSSANWNSYGLSADRFGFGYTLDAAKIVYSTPRTEITAGARVSGYPNERDYAWANSSMRVEQTRDNQLFYAGIPLAIRYHFSSRRVSPFFEFENLLDVRAYQQTQEREFPPFCYGSPQTCVNDEEFKEVAENSLIIWRQTVAIGIRIRLKGYSILLSEGIQGDVTPGREPGNHIARVRAFYLTSKAGISF